MKKLFSFVFAVALTTSLWATTYTPQPGENTIKAILDGDLEDGDSIVLATGTYTEWNSMTFTTQVTIIAAPDAKPVLHWYSINMDGDFEVNGIEIHNVSADSYLLRVNSSNSQNIAIKNCSFELKSGYTSASPYIYLSSYSIGSLNIDNCIFKDNPKSEGAILYAGSATIGSFTMTNSTAYGAGAGGDLAIRCEKCTNVYMDHCTFYNCSLRPIYLKGTTMTSYAVKNCVIASSTATSNYCIATYAGTVDNCVYYNTNAPRSSSPVVVTNCINADPQFVDAANANFNFAFTSPLFLAATDGKNIGDPRWGVEAGTGVAVPGTLTKEDAVLAGPKIEKNDDGIKWKDQGDPSLNSASWTIDVAKAGNYKVTVNVSANSTSTHYFNVSLYDNKGLIETLNEPSSTSSTGAKVCGTFTIAKAGKYMVRLMNATQWSSATAENISITYAGGGVVDVPAVLPNEEAMLNGPKIALTENGIAWNDNGDATQDYAVWNINVAKAGDYTVNMVVSTAKSSGHSFSIDIYDSNNQQVGSTIAEPSGDITLAAGTYTVRLNNGTQWSSAIMESVSIFYKGGGAMAIPGQLPGEEALIAGKMIRLENGSFQWPNKSDVANHYAIWNVTASEEGDVDIYAYIGTPSSGHCFTAALYDGETLKSSVSETATVHTTGEVKLGTISVEDAGTYTIRLTNATEWSATIVDSLVVKEAEGPIEITMDQEDTENADLTTYLDKTVNVNLVRSMPTGMFSTICLPFGASKSGQFVGAKIYYLDSTSVSGDEVTLYFMENTDFYQGIPYIIEPATAVNNPRFENVVIKEPTAGKTEKAHAIFQGTYFTKHLEAGNSNLMFLGQNNTLYFPKSGDTENMKGLRAYFVINQEPGAPIRRAVIRMGTDVVTTLDLVDGQAIPNGKFMLNGQIVIRVNGEDYLLNGMQK